MVFVVFACRIFMKPALQATLRVFGLCGSCVVLVWSALWFLVMCGFWLWSCPRCRCSRLRVHLAKGFVDLWSCASTCPRCRCSRLRALLSMGFVDLWSCPRCRCRRLPVGLARPLALCGLLKRFAHRPTSCYVPFRRHWRRPLQNGENDHG